MVPASGTALDLAGPTRKRCSRGHRRLRPCSSHAKAAARAAASAAAARAAAVAPNSAATNVHAAAAAAAASYAAAAPTGRRRCSVAARTAAAGVRPPSALADADAGGLHDSQPAPGSQRIWGGPGDARPRGTVAAWRTAHQRRSCWANSLCRPVASTNGVPAAVAAAGGTGLFTTGGAAAVHGVAPGMGSPLARSTGLIHQQRAAVVPGGFPVQATALLGPLLFGLESIHVWPKTGPQARATEERMVVEWYGEARACCCSAGRG